MLGGACFVVYGRLDHLKAGTIYDTKFSKTYSVGKYIDSAQHPSYFYICPEATKFTYLICDGSYVYRETYRPDEVEPIGYTISNFMKFLERYGLMPIFQENWRSRY
jgi:hypothetical protein